MKVRLLNRFSFNRRLTAMAAVLLALMGLLVVMLTKASNQSLNTNIIPVDQLNKPKVVRSAKQLLDYRRCKPTDEVSLTQGNALVATGSYYELLNYQLPVGAKTDRFDVQCFSGHIVELKESPAGLKFGELNAKVILLKKQLTNTNRIKKEELKKQISAAEQLRDQKVKEQITAIVNEQGAARKRINSLIPGLTVGLSYQNAFNGFLVEATESQAALLIKNGFKVHRNEKVNMLLDESVPLVGADKATGPSLPLLGATLGGEGVKIAIIDTGIDWTHPDLGGCYGANCKVLGGYNFVSNNNNPKDDNFHGTHVAATATSTGQAPGGFRGVAPNASLLAYKVLNDYGSGQTAWIIGGVDKALDPNADGNLSDYAQVMNLSLGCHSCLPDHPMSQAVNNAIRTGSIVAVAAGNSGPGGIIGSPGNAELAITVGASDKSDKYAYFSSIGPITFSGSSYAKPDIAAPGVDICAARLGNAGTACHSGGKHAAFNGTSMAAPHVAGLAAVMIQANKNLTPPEVKSAMMSTAKDLTYSPLKQGAGRIDAVAAVNKARQYIVSSIVTQLDPVQTNGNTRTIAGRVVGATVETRGYAYTLDIAKAKDNPEWKNITSGKKADGTALTYQLNEKDYADGQYTVRLKAGYDPNAYEATAYTAVVIDKFKSSTPQQWEVLNGKRIDINTSVGAGIQLKDITVQVLKQKSVSDSVDLNTLPWQTVHQSSSPNSVWIPDESIQTGHYVVRLLASYHDTAVTDFEIAEVFISKELKTGSPVKKPATLCDPEYRSTLYCAQASDGPMVAKNAAGQKRVILSTYSAYKQAGKAEAYDLNGNLVWSKATTSNLCANGWYPRNVHIGGNVVVGDFLGRGSDQILIVNGGCSEDSHSTLMVFDYNGGPVSGWPKQIPKTKNVYGMSLSDLDGNGAGEFILTTGEKILIFSQDATLLQQHSVPADSSLEYYGHPATADINGDGAKEVIFTHRRLNEQYWGEWTKIHALNSQGQELPGWPQQFDNQGDSAGQPWAGNLNGKPRVIVTIGKYIGDNDLGWDLSHKLLVLDGNANFAEGWPLESQGWPGWPGVDEQKIHSAYSPVVVDANNDGSEDIIGDTKIYQETAAVLASMPFYTAWQAIDVTGDENMELFGTRGSYDSRSPWEQAGGLHGFDLAGNQLKYVWPQVIEPVSYFSNKIIDVNTSLTTAIGSSFTWGASSCYGNSTWSCAFRPQTLHYFWEFDFRQP